MILCDTEAGNIILLLNCSTCISDINFWWKFQVKTKSRITDTCMVCLTLFLMNLVTSILFSLLFFQVQMIMFWFIPTQNTYMEPPYYITNIRHSIFVVLLHFYFLLVPDGIGFFLTFLLHILSFLFPYKKLIWYIFKFLNFKEIRTEEIFC